MNKTIETFINNMFVGIKMTDELRELKEDLTTSSYDKFEDLVNQGYTENEAIGKVISEFGSIEELIDNSDDNIVDFQAQKNVNNETLISTIKNHSFYIKMVSIATAILILIAFIVIILAIQNSDDIVIVLVVLLGSLAPIGLYIYAGINLNKSEFVDISINNFDKSAIKEYKNQLELNNKAFPTKIIMGVSSVIIGATVFVLIFGFEEFNISTMYLIFTGLFFATGVYLFISAGNKTMLLNRIDSNNIINNSKPKEKEPTLTEKLVSAMFMVVTLVYITTGFIWGLWRVMWVMYPIAGILAGIINIFSPNNKKEK